MWHPIGPSAITACSLPGDRHRHDPSASPRGGGWHTVQAEMTPSAVTPPGPFAARHSDRSALLSYPGCVPRPNQGGRVRVTRSVRERTRTGRLCLAYRPSLTVCFRLSYEPLRLTRPFRADFINASNPRALPWAGMSCPFGAEAHVPSLKSVLFASSPGLADQAYPGAPGSHARGCVPTSPALTQPLRGWNRWTSSNPG